MKVSSSFITFFLLTLSSFGQVTFQKAFGGIENDNFRHIQSTYDGAYIISGAIGSIGAGGYDKWLLKIDINGDTLWTKTYGGFSLDEGRKVKQTPDGGYAIFGAGGNNWNATIVKADSTGSFQWSKTYGDGHNSSCFGFTSTSDSGFIFTGYKNDSITGGLNLILLKTDSIGDTLWTRELTDTLGGLIGYSLQQTYDGGFIVGISCWGFTDTDVLLLKTNSGGNILWAKKYLAPDHDNGFFVIQTSDTGILVAGDRGGHLYLLKTDQNGNFQWSKTYGGSSNAFAASVIQTFDGGYLLSGSLYIPADNNYSIYIIKTNSFGDTLWTNAIGDSINTYSTIQTVDSGYMIVGTCVSCGAGMEGGFIAKTDSFGRSGCFERNTETIVGISAAQILNVNLVTSSIIETFFVPPISVSSGCTITTHCSSLYSSENSQSTSLRLFPNPASSAFTISSTSSPKNAHLEIYNLFGEKIFSAAYCEPFTVNCELFSTGIYFVTLQSENGLMTQKLIKQ